MEKAIRKTVFFILLLTGSIAVFAQPCLPDGIIFNSQAQLDSFQILYPNCSEIEGNVQIHQNSDIHDLSPLSNITTIGGNLWVSSYHLDSLYGLHNLEYIGSELSLFGGNYYNLNELGSLRSIQGGLQVVNCDELEDFSELESLQYLGGGIQIIGNDNFANLNGLQGIDSIPERLDLRDNPNLGSLEGLNNLVYIGGDLQLIENASLSDLSGLGNLTKIDGKLEVDDCDSLLDLQGLNNLQSIGEDLNIKNCFNLMNFEGLDEMVYIGGEVYLWQNHSLENLDGLDNLSEIGSDLSIVFNNSLVNLNGLHNLIDMGPELMIFNNDQLSNISGLENLDENQLEKLIVISNPLLSDCSIQIICSFLNTGSEAFIGYNMTGCASVEEVEEACDHFVINEDLIHKSLSIFPNPAQSLLNIRYPISDIRNQGYIYNSTGLLMDKFQTVVNQDLVSIDITDYPSGIYLVKMGSKTHVLTQKFIKQ